jgi:hypothetical protein
MTHQAWSWQLLNGFTNRSVWIHNNWKLDTKQVVGLIMTIVASFYVLSSLTGQTWGEYKIIHLLWGWYSDLIVFEQKFEMVTLPMLSQLTLGRISSMLASKHTQTTLRKVSFVVTYLSRSYVSLMKVFTRLIISNRRISIYSHHRHLQPRMTPALRQTWDQWQKGEESTISLRKRTSRHWCG